MKWTAADVVSVVRAAYGIDTAALITEEWSLLTEVPLRSASASKVTHFSANQRTIDVLLVRNWTSGTGHERLALEVKVSRADYKNETDLKREPAEHAAHRTAYCAPAGLIAPATLPPGWGLIEVYPTHGEAARGPGHVFGDSVRTRAKWRVKPERRTPVCDLDYLAAVLARRAGRAEERIRRGEEDPAKVVALSNEVERLADALARRDTTLARAQDRLREARAQIALLSGDGACADCGQPLRFGNRGWEHKVRADSGPCETIRREAVRQRRQAATGSEYLLGWADPIETVTAREARLADDFEGGR